MDIAFLHTAHSHVALFEALLAELAPGARSEHIVRTDFLEHAATGALPDALARQIAALARADVVLCTCSSLGPMLDRLPLGDTPLVRIDRALMMAACGHGPTVLLAHCLPGARGPAIDLLEETARHAGVDIAARPLDCGAAWTAFQSGDISGFEAGVADLVRAACATGDVDCVVLAQASMAGAVGLLGDLGLPVLTSPRLAVATAVDLGLRKDARRRR